MLRGFLLMSVRDLLGTPAAWGPEGWMEILQVL